MLALGAEQAHAYALDRVVFTERFDEFRYIDVLHPLARLANRIKLEAFE